MNVLEEFCGIRRILKFGALMLLNLEVAFISERRSLFFLKYKLFELFVICWIRIVCTGWGSLRYRVVRISCCDVHPVFVNLESSKMILILLFETQGVILSSLFCLERGSFEMNVIKTLLG